jgi:hypothetical protein
MLAGAQEDISTYIIKGLGSQRGFAAWPWMMI